VNVAVPVADNEPVPNEVVPSKNVTVPVGVPAPGAATVTVAVNVTACPKTGELTDEATVVVVLALLTTWLTAVLVLALKLAFPA
jgi:hypothetical protein